MIINAHTNLGTQGIEYVYWSLSHSTTALASFLLREIPLGRGHAFTFTMDDIDPSRLNDFHDGVFGQRGAGEVRAALGAFIIRYLQREPPRYLVFEDVNSRASDPGLSASDAHYVVHSVEVYHFLEAGNVTEKAVSQTIAYANGFVTNGILTSDRMLPILRDRENLDALQLVALAKGTDYILSEAYDNEGFVIWARSG
jgi:hypothetical protein